MLNNLKCVETNWNTYKINSKVIFENRQRRVELSVLATVQLNLPHLEIGAKRRERRKRERKRRSERDEEWGERRSKVKRCTSGAWNDITPEVTAFQYRKVTFNWRTNNHSPSSSESFLCVLTPPTFHEHVCHHLLRWWQIARLPLRLCFSFFNKRKTKRIRRIEPDRSCTTHPAAFS